MLLASCCLAVLPSCARDMIGLWQKPSLTGAPLALSVQKVGSHQKLQCNLWLYLELGDVSRGAAAAQRCQ